MFVDTEAICTIALFGFITSVISTLRDQGAAPHPAARYLLVFSLAECQSHSYRNNRRCLAAVSLRGLAFRAQARSQRSTAKKSKVKGHTLINPTSSSKDVYFLVWLQAKTSCIWEPLGIPKFRDGVREN